MAAAIKETIDVFEQITHNSENMTSRNHVTTGDITQNKADERSGRVVGIYLHYWFKINVHFSSLSTT